MRFPATGRSAPDEDSRRSCHRPTRIAPSPYALGPWYRTTQAPRTPHRPTSARKFEPAGHPPLVTALLLLRQGAVDEYKTEATRRPEGRLAQTVRTSLSTNLAAVQCPSNHAREAPVIVFRPGQPAGVVVIDTEQGEAARPLQLIQTVDQDTSGLLSPVRRFPKVPLDRIPPKSRQELLQVPTGQLMEHEARSDGLALQVTLIKAVLRRLSRENLQVRSEGVRSRITPTPAAVLGCPLKDPLQFGRSGLGRTTAHRILDCDPQCRGNGRDLLVPRYRSAVRPGVHRRRRHPHQLGQLLLRHVSLAQHPAEPIREVLRHTAPLSPSASTDRTRVRFISDAKMKSSDINPHSNWAYRHLRTLQSYSEVGHPGIKERHNTGQVYDPTPCDATLTPLSAAFVDRVALPPKGVTHVSSSQTRKPGVRTFCNLRGICSATSQLFPAVGLFSDFSEDSTERILARNREEEGRVQRLRTC